MKESAQQTMDLMNHNKAIQSLQNAFWVAVAGFFLKLMTSFWNFCKWMVRDYSHIRDEQKRQGAILDKITKKLGIE